MFDTLSLFHFLRPLWLVAVPLILLLWYLVRRRLDGPTTETAGLAPHLAEALSVGTRDHRRLHPIDGFACVGVLLALASAGPTWSKLPNPLIADTAPLVVALKVTPSMEQTDLAPSRLERARFKITDLITSRAGARTALVAYAGSAHRVAPLTEDANILRPLLEGLTPQAMPVDGDSASSALTLAQGVLTDAETQGAILFVLDDLDPAEAKLFETAEPDGTQLIFLTALPPGQSLAQLDRIPNATVVQMTADDGDLVQLDRAIRSAYVAALGQDDRLQWRDRGRLLTIPAALLVLLWFRRGWTTRWAIAVLLLPLISAPHQAQAEGWRDWFLTPDQQGQIAMNRKEYSSAGNLFQDRYLAGYAKYKAGQYADAAKIFAALSTPEAAFAEGMARIRNREYRPAIATFERALELRPGWPEAEHNLALSKEILEYIETTREQSDTGEDSGIGADDVVFDNDVQRGADTTTEFADKNATPQTADQWISSIDTDMTKFLRSRFLIENQEAGK
ncbi:VWA domain-containing protein [Tropicibacter sp. Alg240-R139]|uniref:VWA domain-containing protein n=1 Tax=Tropicibacter sp. Alg240-R139 TaxID=2305991 RepID=UPI0013E0CCCA|nr:VWA domain-containing protein [Tropicibacter sp. Alg240-R139]